MNWTVIKEVIKIAASFLWPYLKPVFTSLLAGATKELLEFSTEVIITLSSADLTNDDKRKAAFNVIKNKAYESGNELKDSTINTIIELIYQKVKNSGDIK